jgi:hypothetical protein
MLPTSSWGLRRRRYSFRKTGNSSDQSCTYDTKRSLNPAAGQFSFKSSFPRALNSYELVLKGRGLAHVPPATLASLDSLVL